MPYWALVSLSVATLIFVLALVATVLAMRRVALRAEAVLAIVEQELRPLIGQAHALTEDVRALTRQAGHELERMGALTEKVGGVAEGMGRVVTVLGGLTRAGQLVGLAAGVKKGVEVFVRHLQKNEGGNHE